MESQKVKKATSVELIWSPEMVDPKVEPFPWSKYASGSNSHFSRFHIPMVQFFLSFFVNFLLTSFGQLTLASFAHVSEVSGGFEYSRLGFVHGGVPTELDSVPDTTRRALSHWYHR